MASQQIAPSTSGTNLPASSVEKGPTNLLRPLLLIWYSTQYFFITVFQLATSFQFSTFLSIDDFKDEWFARFWGFFGAKSREMAAPAVMPLLENHARGVCLDIGPGSGMWLHLFARANNPDITKIYGVEPNVGLHGDLRANAAKAGLEGIYEVIGCGAEELQTKGGLQKESIDTIITVHCLCSIPTPELIIRELYPLLKPGGQWLVFEHIKTHYQSDFVGYWQSKFRNILHPSPTQLLMSPQRASTLCGHISSMVATLRDQLMNGYNKPAPGKK